MNIIAATETSLKRITDAKENFLQNILKPLPLWLNADQLTLIRILCIFPIIFFLWNKRPDIAFWFFIFGAFLDLIDGPIARVRKKETDAGKILDPFADKVLAGVALFGIFLSQGPSFLSPLLFWLIIAFEFTLIVLTLIGKAMLEQKGFKRKLGANLWGKWKFFLQTIGISLLLLQRPFWAQIILWPSVVLAIASIIGHLAFKATSENSA
ncbi:MAG: CDP-alcohol phosphatidyltransferase family protein [bacterium]|nr:CDP-alcohol phosphatidyltransferase family protein [bacterium]